MPQIAFQNSYFFEKTAVNNSADGQLRGPIFFECVDVTSIYNFAFLYFALRAL